MRFGVIQVALAGGQLSQLWWCFSHKDAPAAAAVSNFVSSGHAHHHELDRCFDFVHDPSNEPWLIALCWKSSTSSASPRTCAFVLLYILFYCYYERKRTHTHRCRGRACLPQIVQYTMAYAISVYTSTNAFNNVLHNIMIPRYKYREGQTWFSCAVIARSKPQKIHSCNVTRRRNDALLALFLTCLEEMTKAYVHTYILRTWRGQSRHIPQHRYHRYVYRHVSGRLDRFLTERERSTEHYWPHGISHILGICRECFADTASLWQDESIHWLPYS